MRQGDWAPPPGAPPTKRRRSVRWADKQIVLIPPTVLAIGTNAATQFLDFTIEEPRLVRLRLEAVADPPVPGLGITWTIFAGAGATMIVRRVVGIITTPGTLAPLELDFPVSHLRVEAVLTNGGAVERNVEVSGLAAPWGYAYGAESLWQR